MIVAAIDIDDDDCSFGKLRLIVGPFIPMIVNRYDRFQNIYLAKIRCILIFVPEANQNVNVLSSPLAHVSFHTPIDPECISYSGAPPLVLLYRVILPG
jgi:hypothetical protein